VFRFATLFVCLLLFCGCGREETQVIRVAVASNFVETAQLLEQAYEMKSGKEVQLIIGSTGKLIAQISQGAPFDVFLSADSSRAEALLRPSALYAIGRAALWGLQGDPMLTLRGNQYQKIALANPKHAPYGMVSLKALEGVVDKDKIVYGENVRQVYHMVKSGAVDLGCVAWPQVAHEVEGSVHVLDDALEVEQRMVLLSEKGRTFYNYVLSNNGRLMIQSRGYQLP